MANRCCNSAGKGLFLVSSALAATLTLGGVTTSALASTLVTPDWSADRIRLYRNAQKGPVWRINYEKRVKKTGTGKSKNASLLLQLGDGYFLLREENTTVVYDFKLRRKFVIDFGRQRFASYSLMGELSFRLTELGNRLNMQRMAETAGLKGAGFLEPFWSQSELGVIFPNSPRPRISVRSRNRGPTVFSHAGKDAVRLEWSDNPLPPFAAVSYARFLRYAVNIHPLIVDAIVQERKVPIRISYFVPTLGRQDWTTLTLKSLVRVEADYPLPKGFLPTFKQTGPATRRTAEKMIAITLEAIKGRYRGGPPTPEQFREKMHRFYRKGNLVSAAVMGWEIMFMFPTDWARCTLKRSTAPDCLKQYEIAQAIKGDLNVANVWHGYQLDNQGRHLEAAKLWRQAKGRNPEVAHIFDRMIGSALTEALDEEGMQEQTKRQAAILEIEGLFLNAISANPYYTNIYQDIGNYYVKIIRPNIASWFFDLGRALPRRAARHLLERISKIEARMAKDFPGYF